MRKVVFKMHVSLDGYMRSPGGESDEWQFRSYDDDLTAWEVDLLWRSGTHAMGRLLYTEMCDYWPSSTEPWAAPMNEIPKVVFSRTLKRAEWKETRIASGDLAEEMDRLKRESGKDILVHGGAKLAQALAKLGLIDEYLLVVHPAVLAGGLPLFAHPMSLRLLGAKSFPRGTVLLTYAKA